MRSRLSMFARKAINSRAAFATRRRALAADERGVAAVEFAILATPFLGILFAIFETALLLFSGQALDTALQDASRRIMTGQVQNGGVNQAQFKNEICARMTSLVNCSGGLFVDVRAYTAAAPAPIKPITGGGFDPSGFGFNPGGPSQIVVVRAAIVYPVYVHLFGDGMQELTAGPSAGKRVLMSTVSFRNEPYLSP